MMKRYYYIFTVIFLAATLVVAAFVITAAFGAQKRAVYEISVITRGGSTGYWSMVKLGIDSAVSDLNVELSYITPENENDPDAQAEAIRSELDNGARAIIIAPCSDSPVLRDAIEKAAKRAAVVQIEADITEAASCVLTDDTGMARLLSKDLAGSLEPCSILVPPNPPLSVGKRVRSIADELNELGIKWSFFYLTRDSSGSMLANIFPPERNIIISPDTDTLQFAATFAAASGSSYKLCGIGGSSSTAYYLDKGVIDFAVAESAFNMGYVAVKNAVDRLNGEKPDRVTSMDYKLVNAANMYETDNQRILFPFVK